jgi:hypothetical protein
MRPRHADVVFLGTLVLSLLASGCGAASRSPGVASLGRPGTTGSATADAPPGATPSASAGVDNGGQAILIGGGLKFSQCMRAHGVANFPDPNSQGATQFGLNSGINPQSATFQSAAQACRSALHGKGPQLSPAQQAKARRQALAFSACMRKHGIPDFPDPIFGANGNAGIHLSGPPSSDLNANNPTFQAALQACQGFKLGDKKGPGSFSGRDPK